MHPDTPFLFNGKSPGGKKLTSDHIVRIVSTTMQGFQYNVYEDEDQEKILYIGRISKDNPDYDNCTCKGFTILKKCWHNRKAREIMELLL